MSNRQSNRKNYYFVVDASGKKIAQFNYEVTAVNNLVKLKREYMDSNLKIIKESVVEKLEDKGKENNKLYKEVMFDK